MSFLRPEAVALIGRWAEPALSGAAALGLGWLGLRALWAGGLFGLVWLALGAGAAAWCRAAVVRLGLARRGGAGTGGPGIVVVEEGRISYLGPVSGGVVELGSLEAVAVSRRPVPRWDLLDADGTWVSIPGGAQGVERLPDALGALPGFDPERALAAFGSAGAGPVTIWRRPGRRPSRPALRLVK